MTRRSWYDGAIPDLRGRRAIVTGTGGLGFETAHGLAAAGAEVILAGRNPAKGAEAIARLGSRARFEQVDLASLASVAAFAGGMRERGDPIDLLVNNAGIMMPPAREATEDGFERQFGVNHLGHFALTAALLPLLKAGNARVVSVTSLAHRYTKLDFDDLQSERSYNGGKAYCLSKLAQALFAIELQRRSDAGGWGIMSLAAHPGYAGTDLFQNQAGPDSLLTRLSTRVVIPLLGQSAAAGAMPILYAATAADAEGGALYGPGGLFEMRGPPVRRSYAKTVHDADAARRMWEASERYTGAHFD